MLALKRIDRPTFAWVLYDWGNSAFSTTVMAGFFPIFFKQYWSAGVDATVSTLRLGTVNSLASLAVAVVAPLLGAIADAGGSRRRYLILFAALGVLATTALFGIGEGSWRAAAIVYTAAVVGFSASMVFYDALLVTVATPERRDYVSALGFAVGYLGGGLLFAVNVAMTVFPGVFGLSGADAAVRVSFLVVAVWWGAFTIPLALYVREQPVKTRSRTARRDLRDTFTHLRRYRRAAVFLVGYWFYIDGVHTIVRMAVDYGLSIGFSTNTMIGSLLVVQFVGFPASLAFGRLAERTDPRRGIFIGICVYIVVSIWAARLAHAWEFYALAVGIGSVQGAVNSLSRSFYARLIPSERAAQFYGYYNTIGRFSAVLGPILMGWVAVASGNPRASMLAVILLFVVGAAVLARVPDEDTPAT